MFNTATIEFIRENGDKEVAWLALHPPKNPEIDLQAALQQIEGRQKAKLKLPELYANKDVVYPKRVSMEQCSSSVTASYKASLFSGESFADLSGGFGVDTIFLSKKFNKGLYVEPDSELCNIFEHNCKYLGINNIEIQNANLEIIVERLGFCDMIYVDPSRRDTNGNRVVQLPDLSPNILDYKDILLSKCRTLAVKLSPMLSIVELARDLPEMTELHIVSVDNECKEILCVLSSEKQIDDVKIITKNVKGNIVETFSQWMSLEKVLTPQIAKDVGNWLYEPNAAVMKSGLFNTVSDMFCIGKLASNTNLYTSDEPVAGFPGRVFRVLDVIPYQPKKFKNLLSPIETASISVRNFPISAEELRKTLKIKDGNGCFIFGTTLSNGQKVIMVCSKAKF